MAKTRHIHQKLNKSQLIETIVMHCESIDGELSFDALAKLIELRRKIRQIEESGGIIVVESESETLMTAYRINSFRMNLAFNKHCH